MNLSLEDCKEFRPAGRNPDTNEMQTDMEISMGMSVIRGNSILMIDCQAD